MDNEWKQLSVRKHYSHICWRNCLHCSFRYVSYERTSFPNSWTCSFSLYGEINAHFTKDLWLCFKNMYQILFVWFFSVEMSITKIKGKYKYGRKRLTPLFFTILITKCLVSGNINLWPVSQYRESHYYMMNIK